MANAGNRGFGGAEQHSGQQAGRTSTGGAHGSRPEEGSLGGTAAAVKDKAQELASTVASRAGEAWDSTRQTAQQAASAVTSTAEDTWEEVAGFMRRYPIATFCVGIGVGFLLSRLLEDQGTSSFGRMGWGSFPSDFRGQSQSGMGSNYPLHAGS